MVEMQVQSWASPCGVYGGQSGTGTFFFFSLSFSFLPCHRYSTYAQHSFIHSVITYTLLTVESNAK